MRLNFIYYYLPMSGYYISNTLIQMQNKALFSKTIKALTNMINSQTTYKNLGPLRNLALSLGIPICPNSNRQTTVFVITQAIFTLIDQIVDGQKQGKNPQIKKQPFINFDFESHQIQSQQKTTLKNFPKCLNGNLNIVALIYQMFCTNSTIWEIILKIAAIKKELEKQGDIFQVVSLHKRILRIESYTNSESVIFKCHCLKYYTKTKKKYILNCHQCLQEFHPCCQSTSFYCNSCFLRYCLMDLKDQLNDPFNYHKQIKVKFFGYLKNQFPPQKNPQIAQSIFFNVVKFDLPEFRQQADRKTKYYQIRIAVVDKIFPDQLQLALRPNLKMKMDISQFWELDNVEYHFYLNHNLIKFSQTISRNCIILKIPHKNLYQQANILIIKIVRRDQKYQYKYTNVFAYWPQKQNPSKVLMIGVYQINKKKVSAKLRDTPTNSQSSQTFSDTLGPITIIQSSEYYQYIQNYINQVGLQIVNLYNQSGSKKIQIPVRSFGCHHIECFDYAQFKQLMNPRKEKVPRKQKMPKYSKLAIDNEKVIEIEQSSSQVIQISGDKEIQNSSSKKAKNSTVTKKISKHISSEIYNKKKGKKETEPNHDLLCPICHRKLLILYVDPLFKDIISNSGFYKKVKIQNNGGYDFNDILKSQKVDDIQMLN